MNRVSRSYRPRRSLALVGLLLLGTAACSTGDETASSAADSTVAAATSGTDAAATTTVAAEPTPVGLDIVATAVAGKAFYTLTRLVVDAGLVEPLRGGPFTVFAPTDAGFSKIPADILQAVEDSPETLSTVLLHHVVEGALTPETLVEGPLTTLAGDELAITKVGDQFYVDGNPIGPAVEATNGEIFVINDVLVPALGDIVTVATTLPGFTTLAELVTAADLIATLQGDGPFTVFAPVDGGFEAVPAATLAAVTADPSGLMTQVLTYHVVAGKLTTDMLEDGPLKTVNGAELTISHDADGNVLIDGNPIAVQNVQASNGVIHAMGSVLIPS